MGVDGSPIHSHVKTLCRSHRRLKHREAALAQRCASASGVTGTKPCSDLLDQRCPHSDSLPPSTSFLWDEHSLSPARLDVTQPFVLGFSLQLRQVIFHWRCQQF
ncbi:unnamed protein product [Pleuronectes platessa]|uniref:Uncharacterized protein n=1 Tax=Pleuronectes platessa TaxID=8262 RepID=A0A9N7U3W8_PLEPL|nr:unnamed protein product [Pleuronectes platessa]